MLKSMRFLMPSLVCKVCASTALRPDRIEPIPGLTPRLIKKLSTASIFKRAKIFEVKHSFLISTSVDRSLNSIAGEFRSALIYEQSIFWGSTSIESPFCLDTIHVLCTCKYYNKETVNHGRCCKHILYTIRALYKPYP